MKKLLEVIIWLSILVSFIRGVFVFDQGPSASDTYPTASAICLVGAIIAAVLWLKIKATSANTT